MMKIKLIVLRCLDIEETKSFYEKLGFYFKKEKHGKGVEHYSTILDEVVMELYPALENNTTDNTRLGFIVDDLDVVVNAITPVSEYVFEGQKTYVLLDPDRRKVEVS